MKKKMYIRTCKYCEEDYETSKKHSCVCPDCKAENHEQKVINTLFKNGIKE